MNSLESLRIAKNCPASWDAMAGDERIRHCGQCDRKVYSLSDMTREEAEKLISNSEGRICVRYYLRKDGTVMTRDCGAPTPNKRHLAFAALAAAIPLLTGCNNEPDLPLMGKLAMPESAKKTEPMMGSVDYPTVHKDKGTSKK